MSKPTAHVRFVAELYTDEAAATLRHVRDSWELAATTGYCPGGWLQLFTCECCGGVQQVHGYWPAWAVRQLVAGGVRVLLPKPAAASPAVVQVHVLHDGAQQVVDALHGVVPTKAVQVVADPNAPAFLPPTAGVYKLGPLPEPYAPAPGPEFGAPVADFLKLLGLGLPYDDPHHGG